MLRRAPIKFQKRAAIIWLVAGISIGIVSALKRRTLLDRFAMGFALFGVSAAGVLAKTLGLIHLISITRVVTRDWLRAVQGKPVRVVHAHDPCPGPSWPSSTPRTTRGMVRGNLIETMGEDYIRTARAKGLPESKVVGKHGLRASLTPVVTLFGIFFFLCSAAQSSPRRCSTSPESAPG